MTPLLESLGQSAWGLQGQITTGAVLFTRLSMVLLLMPGIGEASLPMRIRIVLALTLMGLVLPLVAPVEGPVTVPLIVREALIGFTLGFGVRSFLFALSVTGAVIAQALSLSQVFGFASEGDSASLVSSALVLAAGTLFLTSDLEIAVLRALVDGFSAVPPGTPIAADPGAIAQQATQIGAEAIRLGVVLSVPFMVLNFSYYLVLGFLNKAMPQLMITFVGLPAITLSGLILLAASTTALLSTWLLRVSAALAP